MFKLTNKSIKLFLGVEKMRRENFEGSEQNYHELHKFYESLRKLLNRLVHILSLTSHGQWGGQQLKWLVVTQFPPVEHYLSVYLNTSEWSVFVGDFLLKLRDMEVDGRTDRRELVLKALNAVVMSDNFIDTACREVVFEGIVALLPRLLVDHDNVEDVYELIDKLMERLHVIGDTVVDVQNVKDITLSLLDTLFTQLRRCGEGHEVNSGLLSLITPIDVVNHSSRPFTSVKCGIHSFIGLLDFLRFDGMKELIEINDFPQKTSLKIVSICLLIMQRMHRLYPMSWVAIQAQVIKSIMRCLHVIFSVISTDLSFDDVIEGVTLDHVDTIINISTPIRSEAIWIVFLETVVYILCSPILGSENKGDAQLAAIGYVHNNFDDLRERSSPLLIGMWNEINDTVKTRIFVDIIPCIFLLLGSNNERIRNAGAEILLDIFKLDLQKNNSVSMTSSACLRYTIQIFQKPMGGGVSTKFDPKKVSACAFSKSEFERVFDDIIPQMIATDSSFKNSGATDVVEDISQYIKLVNHFILYAENSAYFEEMIDVAIHLMGFTHDKGHMNEYFSILHSLSEEYCSRHMFIEASYLLTNHAEMLEWSDSLLPRVAFGFREVQELPETKSWERRVYLMEKAINLCDHEDSQYWERSVLLLEQLIQEYRSNHLPHGHEKIKSYLNRQIFLHDKMNSNMRIPSSVFMVGYYGGFSGRLQNKEFVYRRVKSESLSEFASTICAKYPEAKLMKMNQIPSEQEILSSEQHVRIIKLYPFNPHSRSSHSNSDWDQTDVFQYSIPNRKNHAVENEFLDLWLTRFFVSVETPLPSITDRAEVVEVSVSELNPIEVAIEGLIERNGMLERGIREMENLGVNKNVSQKVTMELSGTIDAAVNGGIANYYSILSGEYRELNPAIEAHITANEVHDSQYSEPLHHFKEILQSHLDILKRSLEWHKRKCDDSMAPLHEHMEHSLATIIADIEVHVSK